MKKILVVCFCSLIVFAACTTKEAETYTGVLGEVNQNVSLKVINGKVTLALQELSKLCNWDCLPCGRCGDDQIDYHGGDILLIKWDQKKLVSSGSGQEYLLPVKNTVEENITWVSIKILDILSYDYNLDKKEKVLSVFKTETVIEREAKDMTAQVFMSEEELKEIINTKKLWDGKKHIVEDAEYALIDVRTPEEFSEGHIPHSVNYPLDTLKEGIPAIPKDRKIIVYCKSGKRSSDAKLILRRQGFENVENYGGINRWSDIVEKGLEGRQAQMLGN